MLADATMLKATAFLRNGSFQWMSNYMQGGVRNHIDADGRVFTGEEDRNQLLNCWEAIFVVKYEWIKRWFGDDGQLAENTDAILRKIAEDAWFEYHYQDFLRSLIGSPHHHQYTVGINGMRECSTVYFLGDAHVCLSHQGKYVWSLWNGPDGNTSWRLTTFEDLYNHFIDICPLEEIGRVMRGAINARDPWVGRELMLDIVDQATDEGPRGNEMAGKEKLKMLVANDATNPLLHLIKYVPLSACSARSWDSQVKGRLRHYGLHWRLPNRPRSASAKF